MTLSGNMLISLSTDSVYLKKNHQTQNLIGFIQITNISYSQIAVKIRSNNPSSYLVTPSQIILNPSENAKVQFTKNNQSLSISSDKLDKFQFIAVEIDSSLIYLIKNTQKVDDQIFSQKHRKNQKLVLEVQIGSEFNFNMNQMNGSNGLGDMQRHRFSLGSQSLKQILQSPQQRSSNPKGNSIQSLANDQKFNNILSQSQSSLKNPMSPSFHKGVLQDKDKIYKYEYEKLIQKVHEYEKSYQQLDQEIKMSKGEKEKWNQMQHASKITHNQNLGYEAWHVMLVILVSMFIGVMWAK